MRIWHVGASNSPLKVDGINQRVWTLARYQGSLDSEVVMLLAEEPENWVKGWAEAWRVRICYVSGG